MLHPMYWLDDHRHLTNLYAANITGINCVKYMYKCDAKIKDTIVKPEITPVEYHTQQNRLQLPHPTINVKGVLNAKMPSTA